VTAAKRAEPLPPWVANLSPECQAALRRNVAAAPEPSDAQIESLAALLRTGGGPG
jgi:hypothetical protein